MPTAKSFLTSKTIWLNALALSYGVVTTLHGPITTVTPEQVAVAAAVANLVVRYVFTKGPIAFTA